MSTPVTTLPLTVTATSDQTAYAPGALITVDAAALQALAVAAIVSASLNGVDATVEVDFSVEEAAAGATFGISDNSGGLIQWNQTPGTDPGTIVFTATAPGTAS